MNERGKEILRQADETNRKTIENQMEEISSDWRDLVSGLEGRRNTLEALYEHWEQFETQWTNVEARLNEIEERNKFTQTIVRSGEYLLDTIGVLNVNIFFYCTTIFLLKNFNESNNGKKFIS